MLRLEAGVPYLRRRHPISTLQSSRKMGRIRESGAHGDSDHPEMIKTACLKHSRPRNDPGARGQGGRKFSGFNEMARPDGFEPPTPTFVALYSIQLSYGRTDMQLENRQRRQ